MNIFALDECPYEAAAQLNGSKYDKKRMVKMVTETAQILSTALWLNGYSSTSLYRPTHRNHPVVAWAAATRGNFDWLCAYWLALIAEYTYDYRRRHKASNLYREILQHRHYLPEGPRQAFVNCARNKEWGVDYTWVSDVHQAYQFYLMAREELAHLAKTTPHNSPKKGLGQ